MLKESKVMVVNDDHWVARIIHHNKDTYPTPMSIALRSTPSFQPNSTWILAPFSATGYLTSWPFDLNQRISNETSSMISMLVLGKAVFSAPYYTPIKIPLLLRLLICRWHHHRGPDLQKWPDGVQEDVIKDQLYPEHWCFSPFLLWKDIAHV